MKTKSAKTSASESVAKGGILCGTDFSSAADVAVKVAADFARQLGVPLTLAQAVELPHALKGEIKASRWITTIRKGWLRETAEATRKRGVEVLESVSVGSADEVLVRKATAEKARMIVLSSLGERSPGKWLLGSVAERSAERTETPTLGLRNSEPLRAW